MLHIILASHLIYTNSHADCCQHRTSLTGVIDVFSCVSLLRVPVYLVTTSKADRGRGELTHVLSTRPPVRGDEDAESHREPKLSWYEGDTFHRQGCHWSEPLYHPHETGVTPQSSATRSNGM